MIEKSETKSGEEEKEVSFSEEVFERKNWKKIEFKKRIHWRKEYKRRVEYKKRIKKIELEIKNEKKDRNSDC